MRNLLATVSPKKKQETASELDIKQYNEVTRMSEPFWLTKGMGTYKMWVFLFLIYLAYFFTLLVVIKQNLFSLNEFLSKDFFDQDDHRTSKFFVELKLGEVIQHQRDLLALNEGKNE